LIKVQIKDFDFGREVASLSEGNPSVGGVCAFSGLVRDMAGDRQVDSMTLEHYPGMTENSLAEIETEAHRRWPLEKTLIIHRYGRLEPGDRIVLVAASSAHRDAAFDACRFLIDWLKTKAPFWKLEGLGEGSQWVRAKDVDTQAHNRWLNDEKKE
jgi:molybdopterin synthase catalytic subunit